MHTVGEGSPNSLVLVHGVPPHPPKESFWAKNISASCLPLVSHRAH